MTYNVFGGTLNLAQLTQHHVDIIGHLMVCNVRSLWFLQFLICGCNTVD